MRGMECVGDGMKVWRVVGCEHGLDLFCCCFHIKVASSQIIILAAKNNSSLDSEGTVSL